MTDKVISDICTASTLKSSLNLYNKYTNHLTSYRFIFASKKGNVPDFSVNRGFSDGSVVRSSFSSSSIIVLVTEINNAMNKGSVSFRLDYSVSFDT